MIRARADTRVTANGRSRTRFVITRAWASLISVLSSHSPVMTRLTPLRRVILGISRGRLLWVSVVRWDEGGGLVSKAQKLWDLIHEAEKRGRKRRHSSACGSGSVGRCQQTHENACDLRQTQPSWL